MQLFLGGLYRAVLVFCRFKSIGWNFEILPIGSFTMHGLNTRMTYTLRLVQTCTSLCSSWGHGKKTFQKIIDCGKIAAFFFYNHHDWPCISVPKTPKFQCGPRVVKIVLHTCFQYQRLSKSQKKHSKPISLISLLWMCRIEDQYSRSQDVYFAMLEMFFSSLCTKYDENRWLI